MIRTVTYGEFQQLINEQNEIAQTLADKSVPQPTVTVSLDHCKEMYHKAVVYFNSFNDYPLLSELCVEREIIVLPVSKEMSDLLIPSKESEVAKYAAAALVETCIGYVLIILIDDVMRLEPNERKGIYVHELTHYDQYASGRLRVDNKEGQVYWLGKPYISLAEIPKATIEEYLQWPWEIEAYEAQRRVL